MPPHTRAQKIKTKQKKSHQSGIFSFAPSINENRIQQPILGTSELGMEHPQTQVRVRMSL